MILGSIRPGQEAAGAPTTTIADLFARTVERSPDAVALADPPNREQFTDGPPLRLTYAEVDRIVSAIAARLRRIGLPTDSVIGIQLPNTVESVLTWLGVLRAGMIAAPMPLLWRRADAAIALTRLGARAIITTARIGEVDHCALATLIAAEIFSIRHVLSFGPDLLDGVVPLDDLLFEEEPEPLPAIDREGNPAAHVAVVTWDVTPEGPVAVARNHTELISGGLAALLEAGLTTDAHLLGCCALGSLAGLATVMMPWLLTGGRLSLHHGFAAEAFAEQCREDRCDTIVLPGAAVAPLMEAGLLAHAELENVLAIWRAPERLSNAAIWLHPIAKLTDIHVFGETAVLGWRRDHSGLPGALTTRTVLAPHDQLNAIPVADVMRTKAGTLALRGPMVARHAFPPNAERALGPSLAADPAGFVDTGFPCRIDTASDTFTLTGPPRGIVSAGCYRFVMSQLESLIRRVSPGAFIVALPDALSGQRLAGITGSGDDVGSMLAGLGTNPLVSEAFRERDKSKAA